MSITEPSAEETSVADPAPAADETVAAGEAPATEETPAADPAVEESNPDVEAVVPGSPEVQQTPVGDAISAADEVLEAGVCPVVEETTVTESAATPEDAEVDGPEAQKEDAESEPPAGVKVVDSEDERDDAVSEVAVDKIDQARVMVAPIPAAGSTSASHGEPFTCGFEQRAEPPAEVAGVPLALALKVLIFAVVVMAYRSI